MKEAGAPAAVNAALASSRAGVDRRLAAAPTVLDPAREAILLDLLQHEAQHHGQLIRYF